MFGPEDYFTMQTVYLHFIYLFKLAVVLTGFPKSGLFGRVKVSDSCQRFLSELVSTKYCVG